MLPRQGSGQEEEEESVSSLERKAADVLTQELEMVDYLDWIPRPINTGEMAALRQEMAHELAARLARHRRRWPRWWFRDAATYFEQCLNQADPWLTEITERWGERYNRDRYRFVMPVLSAVHKSRHVRSGRYVPPVDLEKRLTDFIMKRIQGGDWGPRPQDDDEVDRRGLLAIRDAFKALRLPPVPATFRRQDLNDDV